MLLTNNNHHLNAWVLSLWWHVHLFLQTSTWKNNHHSKRTIVAWTQNGFLLPWGGLASQWLCFKAGNEPLLKAAHTSFGIPVELLKNQSDDNAETPETHFVYLMDQTFSQQPVGITSEAEINSCLYQWGSSRLTYGTSLYLQVKVRLQKCQWWC